MNNHNPYSATTVRLDDIQPVVSSELNSISVAPTVEELESAERVLAARLDKKIGNGLNLRICIHIAGIGLVAYSFIHLWGAKFPQDSESFLTVPLTMEILLAGVVISAFSAVDTKARKRVLYGEGSKLLRPYVLEINPPVLLVQSTGASARIEFNEIEDVLLTPQQAIVVLSPVRGLIVPSRCFTNTATYKAFVSNLRSKLRTHAGTDRA